MIWKYSSETRTELFTRSKVKKMKNKKNKKQKTKNQTENIKYERTCNKDQNAQSSVVICNNFECPYTHHHEPDPCSLCPYKPIQFEKKNKKKDLDYYVAYYGDCLLGIIFAIMIICLYIYIANDERSLLYMYIHHISY